MEIGHIYESRPVHDFYNGYQIDKNAWFENIVEVSAEMETEDRLRIFDFGIDGTVMITIIPDDDGDLRIETDVLRTEGGGDVPEFVDRSYVAGRDEDDLRKVLERLWNKGFEGVE